MIFSNSILFLGLLVLRADYASADSKDINYYNEEEDYGTSDISPVDRDTNRYHFISTQETSSSFDDLNKEIAEEDYEEEYEDDDEQEVAYFHKAILARGKKKKSKKYPSYDNEGSRNYYYNGGKGGKGKKHPTPAPEPPTPAPQPPTPAPQYLTPAPMDLGMPRNNSFPCAEEKIFRSKLFLDVAGNPDEVINEKELLEEAVDVSYDQSLYSLCAFRNLRDVQLTNIVTDDKTIDVNQRLLQVNNDDDELNITIPIVFYNFTLDFDVVWTCTGCPDDAALFAKDDASRRRLNNNGRSLQQSPERIEGACYCDSGLIEEGFVDNVGPNIAPTKTEFLREFNDYIEEREEEIQSVEVAYDAKEVDTTIIGPEPCLAVSLDCTFLQFGEVTEFCSNRIETIEKDKLLCNNRRPPRSLQWIYRGTSCSATNTNQQSLLCEDSGIEGYNGFVFIQVLSGTETELYRGVVLPGDLIRVNNDDLEVRANTLAVLVFDSDQETLLQSIFFNITCEAEQDITIGKTFGSLQLASYTDDEFNRENGFEQLSFDFIVQNISPTLKNVASIAFDFNGESMLYDFNNDDNLSSGDFNNDDNLSSGEVTTNEVSVLLPIYESSSNFATLSVVATGTDGQICREDNNVLVLVRDSMGTPVPTSDAPISAPVSPPVGVENSEDLSPAEAPSSPRSKCPAEPNEECDSDFLSDTCEYEPFSCPGSDEIIYLISCSCRNSEFVCASNFVQCPEEEFEFVQETSPVEAPVTPQ